MKGQTDDFNMMIVELLQRIKDFLKFASKIGWTRLTWQRRIY